ncbi:MAG: InlB B-repeat-containing protein [Treponema sp.]|jgi:uncharacterized repeat protein (TIGR02543 family)|nr:InlB B-repeat-containing protein [Treponema sp.]
MKKSLIIPFVLLACAGLLSTACKDDDPTEPPVSYTVTFDKNGGTTDAAPTTKTVTAPATTVGTLPTPPDKTGSTFAGWNMKADGTGSAFTASTVVTASITVYAKWTLDSEGEGEG